MSTSTIKSSMPGVGTSPPAPGHSILPMNVVAQKVVPGSDSGAMKPLSGGGLSYVTLQPASQPLSLVQDHRPTYQQQPQPYNSNTEKETDDDKSLVSNGAGDIIKTDEDTEVNPDKQSQEPNRNNNLSPESSSIESQDEGQMETQATSCEPGK